MEKRELNLVKDFSSTNLDTHKNEISRELKNADYNDLENIVYRIELTYDENLEMIDIKYIAGLTIGYTLPPGL